MLKELLNNYKAHLKITKEKNCASCNKKIGEKTFVVYPNGVIAHHTCVNNNLNECPMTK